MSTESSLLGRARGLRSDILAAREEIEEARRLTPEIAETLRGAEMFRLLVPADAGGLECAPLEACKIYEELARADASVAWVTWNNGLPAVLSRSLSPTSRKEIFSNPHTTFANSTRPSGTATEEGSGFRIRGQWSLVSGCQLADWIPVMASVKGSRDMRMFFVERGDFEILDTWYTGGLRGSGSHDVVIDDVLVPGEHSCSPLAPPTIDGPLHRFPFLAVLSAGCASMSLGIAQAAFEAVLRIVEGNPTTDSGPPLPERAVVHSALAEAEGEIEAARLFLHSAVGSVWEECQEGKPSPLESARLYRAITHAAIVTKRAVGKLFEAGGTSSLYTDGIVERCHRDIWTISQHVSLSPLWRAQAGRVRVGLEPSNPLF